MMLLSTVRWKPNVFLACLLLAVLSILVAFTHFASSAPFGIGNAFGNSPSFSSSPASLNAIGKSSCDRDIMIEIGLGVEAYI
jgi:hypothetical protein